MLHAASGHCKVTDAVTKLIKNIEIKFMLLQRLRCFHFKNYNTLELTFASQLNYIIGANGAGKTNLLDAIHYLSLTKSAFNPIDAQNILHGEDALAIQGHFCKGDQHYDVQCTVHRGQGKTVATNGKIYQKLRDHIGRFPVVLTTPYDVDLIQGKSEVRRRFFDSILCQLDSTYLNTLAQYQQVLKQRNGLLRMYPAKGLPDQDLLRAYDHQLLPLGKRIYEARKAFAAMFVPSLQTHYQYFVAAPEVVDLAYTSEVAHPDFEQQYRDSLPQDLAAQRTTLGVHRDDFIFTLNGHSLKKLGSQGQQKSFILALRLAQFACLQQVLHCKPLLLLDDVFDKLDEERLMRLVSLVAQEHFGQIWITDAQGARSISIMKQLRADKALFRIDQGRLVARIQLT